LNGYFPITPLVGSLSESTASLPHGKRHTEPWVPPRTRRSHEQRLYHSFGPQRLMWATDWPIIKDRSTYDKALTLVRDEMKFFSADNLP
jgi:predicted TIM-barrel fold metal-dependent hydrolase